MRQNGVVWKDLLYGVRALRRSPVFTTAAVLSLALGIGANTAIFSLLYQVVLRSLPIADPERLVAVHGSYSGPGDSSSSWSTNSESVFPYPFYRDLRDRDPAFAGILACASAPVRIAWRSGTQAAQAEMVTGNYFTTLGVPAVLGRVIAPEDDGAPGANPVAVIGHGFWSSHLGANPAIVDQKVAINGQPFVVIGVASADFHGLVQGDSPDLFVPIAMQRAIAPAMNAIEDRTSSWLTLFARLKPGESTAKAQAATDVVFHAILDADLGQGGAPRDQKAREAQLKRRLELRPAARGIAELREKWERPLTVLTIMAGLVLLSACANVAGLLVARRRGAAAGNRHPAGFGGATLGAREAVAHRGCAVGHGGDGSRPAVGTLEHLRVASHSAAGCGRRLGDELARAAGARLLVGAVDDMRAAVRPGSRTAGDQANWGR